jgi:hypothetical protein
MGYIKTILMSVAASALLVTHVSARDNVRFNVNIGSYGQSTTTTHTQVITHYPNTVIYSRTPQVIYHSAPTVIQYVPVISHYNVQPRQYNYYRHWRNGWNNNHQHVQRHQQMKRGKYLKRQQHVNRNQQVQRNGRVIRNQNVQRRNPVNTGNRQMQRQRAENSVGHYRGNYKSRW